MSTAPEIRGYGLSREEIAALSNQLVPTSTTIHQQFDIRVLSGAGAQSLFAQSVEGLVFEASFGITADQRRESWAHFEQRSFSITGFERDDSSPDRYYPRGTLRLIRGSTRDHFPTVSGIQQCWDNSALEVLESYQLDWTRTWDIATLAIDPVTRGTGAGRLLVIALLHTLYRFVHANHIGFLVGILTDRIYAELNRLGLGFIPLAESKPVPGRTSRPCLLIVARLPETLRPRPDFAELLRHGRSLRGWSLAEYFSFPEDTAIPM